MRKIFWIYVLIVIILIGGIFSVIKVLRKSLVNTPVVQTIVQADYKNSTYIINNQAVALVDGHSEMAFATGSASKTVTEYFGNDAVGDLNGDGLPDTAFLITQNSGGSGTFYYVVVALKTTDGYQGTNAVLLGDRIAPQTTEIKDGELIVNYTDRKLGESMSTQPSIGISKYLRVEGVSLIEVNNSLQRKK